jgi:hypothetical protein
MNEQQLIQQRQQQLAQVYDPQEQFIEQQKAALPGQFKGQKSALEQAKVNAFRDISQTANRRGMFFSGFQPAEQARYLGERYLPGLQDIDARQETARLGLLEQLIGVRSKRAGEMTNFQEQLRQEALERQAQQEAFVRQQQLQREQIAASRANSQRSASQMSVGDQIKLAEYNEKQPRMVVRGTGSGGSTEFGFTDRNGNPISAARYAEVTGQDIRTVLGQMGQQGDTYAQQVYNNLKRDPNPQANLGQYKKTYSPLFWGT